jgi:branched-subunit amino acid permease
MEDLLIDITGKWAILAIPILAAIIMSLAIESIDQLTPTWNKYWYTFLIVAIIIGVGLTFLFPKTINTVEDIIIIALVNVIFSIVFSKVAGRKFILWVIEKATEKAKGKLE